MSELPDITHLNNDTLCRYCGAFHCIEHGQQWVRIADAGDGA